MSMVDNIERSRKLKIDDISTDDVDEKASDEDKKKKELVKTIDKNTKYRKSHENPYLKKLYAEFLEKPGSKIAHELLHTHYHARKKMYDFDK